MGPVAGLLALQLIGVSMLFAGAVRAFRWRDRRKAWMMASAGVALSVPTTALLGIFAQDPHALTWRWPTGFGPEWRCDWNRPQGAPVCLRRAVVPPQRSDGTAP
jgi:hypothetical protein